MMQVAAMTDAATAVPRENPQKLDYLSLFKKKLKGKKSIVMCWILANWAKVWILSLKM